jgi:hypothetical protein
MVVRIRELRFLAAAVSAGIGKPGKIKVTIINETPRD